MPLEDALTLLKKEYDVYSRAKEMPSLLKNLPSPGTDRDTEDHTFLAPDRSMVKLLRMLADGRTLSIGELDEIADFVQERKRRLEGRRSSGSVAAGGKCRSWFPDCFHRKKINSNEIRLLFLLRLYTSSCLMCMVFTIGTYTCLDDSHMNTDGRQVL